MQTESSRIINNNQQIFVLSTNSRTHQQGLLSRPDSHNRKQRIKNRGNGEIDTYYKKHWEVVEKSIHYFLLQKIPINIVALQKSLSLLVQHGYLQQIQQSLKSLWQNIWRETLSKVQRRTQQQGSMTIKQQQQKNPLISLIQHYKTIQSKLYIIFRLLKSYLSTPKSTKIHCTYQHGSYQFYQSQNTQSAAFSILCKLILESQKKQQYIQQMILLIKSFRLSNYDHQNIIESDQCKNQVRIDLLILKKIGLFRYLQQEFDKYSKDFYVELGEEIQKDAKDLKDGGFLEEVNGFLEREIDLNQIFQPKINTVYYVEKELIRQYYEFMIQNLLQDLITNNNKSSLKIFWKFTLRLKQQAMKKFTLKLKDIIKNIKKYFTLGTNTKQDLQKLISFRNNLFSLTQECFQKNKYVSKLIYNTFQEVLYEEEKKYLNLAIRNVLREEEGEGIEEIQVENENRNKSLEMNNRKGKTDFVLFQISPSKQNFIRQYEIKFCQWILKSGFQIRSLKSQEQMINRMKRQVGNNMMKKLDRMLNDVWRNDKMYYHEKILKNGAYIKSLFLSSDWPVHFSLVFNIHDQLYDMLNEFEGEFKQSIQNKEKDIKWVNEMGVVMIKINGLESTFSEFQATIIMLLDKAIRPLKKQQILGSLNICDLNRDKREQLGMQGFDSQVYIGQILQSLLKNNILTFNPGSQTYDINFQNKQPYKHINFHNFHQKQDQFHQSIKRTQTQRDNSVLIQAAIVRILKKRKNMQRSDITRYIQQSIKNFKPTFQQITKAFQTLHNRQFIQINRSKGIISFIE